MASLFRELTNYYYSAWGRRLKVDLRPLLVVIFLTVSTSGFLLVSCQASPINRQSLISPTSSSNARIPASGRGGVQGWFRRSDLFSTQLFVYLAKITWDTNRQIGVYILDPAATSWTKVDSDGYFYLEVEPGDYALFVGSALEGAIPLQEAPDRIRIIRVIQEQVVDVGDVSLELR